MTAGPPNKIRAKRIAFLFNHDAQHQIAHSAGILGQLALAQGAFQIIVAYGDDKARVHIERLLPAGAAAHIEWHQLTIPTHLEGPIGLLNAVAPARRLARLRYNRPFFAGLDMIVSTERTCLRVKRALGEHAPRFVYIPHGSGDRNVAYHSELAQFDFMLLSGQKLVDEMVSRHLATPQTARVIGYSKFDAVDLTTRKRFFNNDLPVVLYNPHFDPVLSSWYDLGNEVLTYFSTQADHFNLIFAPHVMLFRKKLHYSPEYHRLRKRPEIDARFRTAPNILIDVDGPNLFDMSYTLAADIYIGDASSQLYEFLSHRGACYFFDRQGRLPADAAPRYELWRNG
jgi:hypothetical protein